MNKQQHGSKVAAIFLVAALFMSSCTYSMSKAPQATPTLITPTMLLMVTPLDSDDAIQDITKGTAAAIQTATAARGTPATAQVVATTGTGTALTVTTGTTQTPATPTNALVTNMPAATTAVVVTTVATTPVVVGTVGTLPTSGPKPATYTLQKGEWPYCIARRFNVNPEELLALSGLSSSQSNLLMPGQVLKIPQTTDPFPAARALHPHPATYSVPSSDTTVYGVACYFGDVTPEAIAAANGISVSASLTAGQQLTIP